MDVVACPDCDLLEYVPELPPGGKARCPRCGSTVATRMADPIDLPLALTVTAAIVFIVANTTPLMGLSAVGRQASTTIMGGAYQMWIQGEAVMEKGYDALAAGHSRALARLSEDIANAVRSLGRTGQ